MPRFERTFLQPWRRHLDWSEVHWSMLLDWLRALGVRELVLQWTSWNGIDYTSLPERIAPLVAARRMKLWLGLAFDEEFWRWPVAGAEPAAALLAGWRGRSVELAQRLAGRRSVREVMAGWYLPEEFDAARWKEAAAAVAAHLSASRRELNLLCRKPLAVSGFPSAPAGQAAAFWAASLARRASDQVWMQDGIGAGKADLGSWPAWARAVEAAVKPTGCRMGIIVETFRIPAAGSPPVPAPGDELLRQMEAAREITRQPLTAFDIPEYLSPAGGSRGLEAGVRYAAQRGVAPPPQLLSNWNLPIR